MKTPFLFILFLISCTVFSQQTSQEFEIKNQEISSDRKISPVESKFVAVKFQKSDCLNEEQFFKMNYENAENRKLILQKNPTAFKAVKKLTLFIDPYRAKAGFTDYGYHTLQNQVDQNLTPNGNLLDYHCGTRTYDQTFYNHGGTDYILWPYPWKRMAENTMEIVAAAPGIIINKRDSFNDLNCTNTGNPNWNGVVIEHSDGSVGIYMHFKKNSLTTKGIGDSVSAGEFLGVAGSSGSSTIPHLHFEVRDSNSNLIDPYMGPCNSMNSTSWWQNQENYYVPKINRISTHSTPTHDDACATIENTYEKVRFENGDLLVLKVYYRDIKVGDLTNIKITNPNGTVSTNYNWTQNWGAFYPTAHAYWTFSVTSAWQTGVYKIDVTFGGNTYQTSFGVRANLASENTVTESVSIYPNPVKDILYIKNMKDIASAEIIDLSGKIVKKAGTEIKSGNIDLRNLPAGNYILKLKSTNQDVKTTKFIKK